MVTRVLQGATLIDGTGKDPLPNATVVLSDKIEQVGVRGQVAFPPEAEVIDLTGKTILPGLIDAHVHMGSPVLKPGADRSMVSETLVALAAANNARLALLNGVTTVRDVGSPYLVAIKLRDAIRDGVVPGPRILACGLAISMTGGHGAGMTLEVDSPDEARKAVRQMRKAGADCIKLMANGLSLDAPELTEAEMRAAVEAAHDAGLKVACHASVWKAVGRALAAGVDSIDHGYTLNEAYVEMMLNQGTVLVPTLGTLMQIERIGAEDPHWQHQLPVIRHRLETALASLRLAYRAGVRFVLGTDGSQRPLLRVGEVLPEFEALLKIGLSKMEAIQAATSVAAAALGCQDRLGTVEPGKLADLTILNGNPLDDIKAIGDVFLVIKDGAPVVADGRIARW